MLNLKGPRLLNVDIAAARTLQYEGSGPRLGVVAQLYIPEAQSEAVKLEAGGETEVVVALDKAIPRDAEFTSIPAELRYDAPDGGGQQVSQSSAVRENGEATTFEVTTELPVAPLSLSLRLEGGDVLWTTGSSTGGPVFPLPDLAKAVNACLERQAAAGETSTPIALRFVVESSAGGKATIDLRELEYVRLKTWSWTNELDNTVRVDRNFELDFAGVAAIPLEPLADHRLRLERITLDAVGGFEPERMLGEVVAHDGRAFAIVSSDYSLAQAFIPPTTMKLVGVHCFFHSSTEAELYLEVQADESGVPASGEPLGSGKLALPPAEEEGGSWQFVRLDRAVELDDGSRYWIVLRGIQGRLRLGLQAPGAGYLQESKVNRSGKLWRAFGGEELPLVRLVYLPRADNSAAAVTFQLQGTAVTQAFDPGGETVAVALPAAEANGGPLALIVTSHARGTLSIANVVQVYGAAD